MTRRLLSVTTCGVLAAATLMFGAGTASAATPIGHVDSVTYDDKYQTIDVAGWAGDADTGTAPVRVHVYVDGRGAQAVSTGMTRNDVAAVHPSLGSHTGFYADPVQPPGRGPHSVCVYAINVGAGVNAALGCRTVTVTRPGALLGHIDRIAVDPGDPTQRIATGWVLDPYDAVSPTGFGLVRASGPSSGAGFPFVTASSDLPRPDVDRVYPGNGHNHGFSVRFDATTDVDWLATDRICLAISYFTPGWFGPSTPYCYTYAG